MSVTATKELNLVSAPGMTQVGEVKWYSPVKGYGFICVEGLLEDVFVHVSEVNAAGLPGLESAMKVRFEIGTGPNGGACATELELLEVPQTLQIVPGTDSEPEHAQVGTLKWFSETKKFGFITPKGGGKDVFVHLSSLEASGMVVPADGTTLIFDITSDHRGRREATNLRLG